MLSKPKNDVGKELEVICPYCKKVLEQKPLRKKKCPFCKNFIYPRTLLSTGDELLLTEYKAKEIDLRNKWMGGITDKAFNTHKNKLSKELGQEASDLDVICSIYLANANKRLAKTKDFHSLKMIYYGMSLFLNEAGKDCFSVRQQVAKMELLGYKKSEVVDKVQILTCGKNSCEACQQLDRKVFTIKEALEKMPIPCKECTFMLHDKTRGFCRCCYVPVVDL